MAPSERPSDLAISRLSMPRGEAHDQRVASVIGQVLKVLHDPLQLLSPLDDLLGSVRRGERLGVLEHPLGPPGAVAVVVRGEVVGDPDEPGAKRAPVRLAPGALEVAVRLEERLLGDVLGVVVVTDPVVRVRVDIAQVIAIELLEGAIELGLRLLLHRRRGGGWGRTHGKRTSASRGPPRSLGLPDAGHPLAR